jgi:O-antigen/teichoic acid export membrane protein
MEEITKPLIQSETPHIEIWDNAKRAKNLKIVFWLLIVVTFFAVLSGYFELELLTSIQEGYYILDEEAEANDVRQGIIGIIQTILYIISIVVFLNWFRRAYGNFAPLVWKALSQTQRIHGLVVLVYPHPLVFQTGADYE